MAKGVPENEIAFIHDANTETRKAELFAKVRSGQVRFLLGSTAKMGAGTNVQEKSNESKRRSREQKRIACMNCPQKMTD